jgi:hypothetical protein
MLCTKCNTAIGLFGDNVEIVKKAVEYLQRDYNLPALECSLGKIHRDDAKGWKLLIKTPDGIFPSAMHAGDHYKVNATTIRAWCLENSKYKKDGFSCEKLFLSLNEMKERINDVRN